MIAIESTNQPNSSNEKLRVVWSNANKHSVDYECMFKQPKR